MCETYRTLKVVALKNHCLNSLISYLLICHSDDFGLLNRLINQIRSIVNPLILAAHFKLRFRQELRDGALVDEFESQQ